MNRADMERMAQEAGIVVTGEAVWKLCEMVAAEERRALAQELLKLTRVGAASQYVQGRWDLASDLEQVLKAREK